MRCQRLPAALAAGSAMLLLVAAARAGHTAGSPDPCPPAPCPPAPPPVTTCKVRVCEWVPQEVEEVRTVYKHECRPQKYTAYRCEMVPQTCTKTVTVHKMVKECVMECRTVCVKVPCIETKVEYKSHLKLKRVCETRTTWKKQGHWEYRCEPARESLFERLCGKKDDCCDPCPKYEMKKHWVKERVPVCETVSRLKLVRECEPVCKQVCTYKTEYRTQMVPVTRWKCVPECKTVTYTVCKPKMIPYEACRMVTVCVPCQEKVKVCKLVPKWVEKEVPVCNPCAPACCTPCCHAPAKKGCCR
ncbi:MAG TPA: hypothetical protein VIL46_01685 [Gemmataceae bacterium]